MAKTVGGSRQVIKNLEALQKEIPLAVQHAVDETLRDIQEMSTQNLKSRMNGRSFSHGDDQSSIFDSWEIKDGEMSFGSYSNELWNNSEHAASVEVGTEPIIKGDPYLYLGGPNDTVRRQVKGQSGYNYMGDAINDISTLRKKYMYYLKQELSL